MVCYLRGEVVELVWDQYGFKKANLQTEKEPSQDIESDASEEELKKLFCNFCSNFITALDAAIAINDAHMHTFSNPAGYTYTVHCFRAAPGCLTLGECTAEHTWFSGYEWQIAVCHSCKEQLGWLFSKDQQFYALIADRLRLA
ncbi:MAG: hypothetical protein DHS20C09_17290 [marine bacterium B5-7]|nr:MAG: hypothetical protein DHS20C09_17290 [marine bacterium B5-7]